MRAFSQSCQRRIKAAIQTFERLQTTTYIKFDLLEIRSQITYKKTVIAFVLENHTIRDKYSQKILLHIQNTYGERKKERPNFYGMFRQNLPNSAAFTAILKMKLPQCDAIGVHTPPGLSHEVKTLRVCARHRYGMGKYWRPCIASSAALLRIIRCFKQQLHPLHNLQGKIPFSITRRNHSSVISNEREMFIVFCSIMTRTEKNIFSPSWPHC